MPVVFTDEWAAAWCRQLNASTAYREAATKWDNPIVFVLEAAPEYGIHEEQAIRLDLAGGACHGARAATREDYEAVPYVVAGPLDAWQALLDHRLEPMMSLVGGKLSLRKGGLFSLMPYAGAARAMLEAAVAIESIFPETA